MSNYYPNLSCPTCGNAMRLTTEWVDSDHCQAVLHCTAECGVIQKVTVHGVHRDDTDRAVSEQMAIDWSLEDYLPSK